MAGYTLLITTFAALATAAHARGDSCDQYAVCSWHNWFRSDRCDWNATLGACQNPDYVCGFRGGPACRDYESPGGGEGEQGVPACAKHCFDERSDAANKCPDACDAPGCSEDEKARVQEWIGLGCPGNDHDDGHDGHDHRRRRALIASRARSRAARRRRLLSGAGHATSFQRAMEARPTFSRNT